MIFLCKTCIILSTFFPQDPVWARVRAVVPHVPGLAQGGDGLQPLHPVRWRAQRPHHERARAGARPRAATLGGGAILSFSISIPTPSCYPFLNSQTRK